VIVGIQESGNEDVRAYVGDENKTATGVFS